MAVTFSSLGFEVFRRSNCAGSFKDIYNALRAEQPDRLRALGWSAFERHAAEMVETAKGMGMLHLRRTS